MHQPLTFEMLFAIAGCAGQFRADFYSKIILTSGFGLNALTSHIRLVVAVFGCAGQFRAVLHRNSI